jgi:hypothetical protein
MAAAWDRTVASGTSAWARALLVVQVALSIVLVVGTGLLVPSFYLLRRTDTGVRTNGVLTVRIQPHPNAYRDVDNASYYPALLERVASLPGVRSAVFSRIFPRLVIEPPGSPSRSWARRRATFERRWISHHPASSKPWAFRCGAVACPRGPTTRTLSR